MSITLGSKGLTESSLRVAAPSLSLSVFPLLGGGGEGAARRRLTESLCY